jgi:hypothetical protein
VDSIDIQTEIQWFMRPYLLDFLIEAHSAFRLLPATLFLTVNLLDRYCSKRVVYKRHYQLVGCAALLIVAKYGDQKERVPTIKELKSMCCSLYDDDMFVQMEWHVLQTLGWAVGHPTIDSFLELAIKDLPVDPEIEHMALYICEIAMFHRDFVSKHASTMARTALALARCVLGRAHPNSNDWASLYDNVTLVSLAQQLHQPSQVLSRKYASAQLSRVSKTLEQFLEQQALMARAYTPPSPPCEVTVAVEQKPFTPDTGLCTPQKSQYPSNMANGYLTPPITPDEGYFSGSYNPTKSYGGPNMQLPPTPTPASSSENTHPQMYQHQPPPAPMAMDF